MESYLSASDLVSIATRAAEEELRTGMTFALPIPRKESSRLQIVLLLYRESTKKGDETIHPPHRIVVIDPQNGRVLKNEPCTAKTFGLDQAAGAPVVGFGLDPGMSAEVFWKRHDRFMEISPEVWKLYGSGATGLPQQSRALIKEFSRIFNSIAKKPLLPYYRAVVPDFFTWLDESVR